jgi:hypothetical protein
MFDKVNILLDAVPPYQLCSLLDIPVRTEGFASVITDPKAGGDLYITNLDFIPKHLGFDFVGGNIVDFLMHVKEISCAEAVTFIIDSFCETSDSPALQAISWAKHAIVNYFADITLVNKELLQFTQFSDSRSSENCGMFLSQAGLTIRSAQRLVTVRTGKEIKRTLSKIKSDSISNQIPLADSVGYLILPYYTSHFLPTAIEFYNVAGKVSTTWNVTPHDHGFFGLRSVLPSGSGPVVLDHWKDIISAYPIYLRHGDLASGCLAYKKFDTNTSYPGVKLSRGLLPCDTDNITVKRITSSMSYVKDLRLVPREAIFSAAFEDCFDSRLFLVNNFFQITSESDEYILSYLQELRCDDIAYQSALDLLKTKGRTDILEQVSNYIKESSHIELNGYRIIATKDGYTAVKSKGENVVQQITNFIITLNKTLVFKDLSDTYYVGYVHMGDEQFPLTMSKKESQRPQEIVNAATSAITRQIEQVEDVRVPLLLDNTFGRHLSNVLNNEINNTPVEVGLNKLGWSKNKLEYHSMSWGAYKHGVEYESRETHPGQPHFSMFSRRNLSKAKTFLEDPSANTALAITVAYLCRSYLQLPTPYVRVRNTAQNQQLLKAVLHPFGQDQIIEVNANKRTLEARKNYLHMFSGVPIYCTCAEPRVLEYVDNPVFLLHEGGISFSAMSDEVTKYADWLIPTVVNNILADEAAWFKDLPVSDNISNLIFEGVQVIKHITGVTHVPVEDLFKFPVFYKFLSEFAFPHIEFNLEAQKVRINLRHSKLTRKAISKELSAADIECSNNGSDFIYAESRPVLEILSDFYGAAPSLSSFELPTVIREEKIIKRKEG